MSSDSSDSDANSEPSPEKSPEKLRSNEEGEAEDSDSAPSHRSPSPAQQRPAASSSDESDKLVTKKKRILSSSEEEGEGKEEQDKSADGLFGEGISSSDDDSDKEEGDAVKPADSQEDSDKESIVGVRLYPDPEEEEEPEEDQAPNIITAEAPRVDINFAAYNPVFVKFPNFLSVEKKPFDPDYYEEDEEEDTLDAEGRSRLKLKVENTIRWRFNVDEESQEVRESNAKMVKWSDGTMSMYLGSEIFDVQELPMHDNNHLYLRQGIGLFGQAIFGKRYNFRPHSTDSHTHRKVTMTMADRTRKSGQVRVIGQIRTNPEKERQEAIKKEEELLRASIRRETQQRKTRDRNRYSAFSSSYLEGRDDSDDESVKGRYSKGGKGEAPLIGASDSDDSDMDEKGIEAAKNDEDEDSDDDFGKKKPVPSRKQILTSDEEEG